MVSLMLAIVIRIPVAIEAVMPKVAIPVEALSALVVAIAAHRPVTIARINTAIAIAVVHVCGSQAERYSTLRAVRVGGCVSQAKRKPNYCGDSKQFCLHDILHLPTRYVQSTACKLNPRLTPAELQLNATIGTCIELKARFRNIGSLNRRRTGSAMRTQAGSPSFYGDHLLIPSADFAYHIACPRLGNH